jgi:hypothetical protein
MESQQKNAEKILSEKELPQKSVGFIEDFLLYSDIFLYLVGEIISLRVVLCRDMTGKNQKQEKNSSSYWRQPRKTKGN